MVSGNPFAADSELWKAANAPTPTTTAQAASAAVSPDPFAFTDQRASNDRPSAQQQDSQFPAPSTAPKLEDYSFAELGPTVFAKPTANKEAGFSSAESPASASFPSSAPGIAQQGPQSQTLSGFPGISSHASTPGGPPSSVTGNPSNPPGFSSSQNSTPRQLPVEGQWHPTSGSQSGSGSVAHLQQQRFGGGFETQQPGGVGFSGGQLQFPFPTQFNSLPAFPTQSPQPPPPSAHSSQFQPQQQPGFGGENAFGASAPAEFAVSFGGVAPQAAQKPQGPQGFDRSQPLPDFGFGQASFAPNGSSPPSAASFPGQGALPLQPQGPPGSDEALWDFASLTSLRPKLKGRVSEEPKSKAGLTPMRPTNDGSWVQPWAVNSLSRATSDTPPQVTAHEGLPGVPARPASAAVVRSSPAAVGFPANPPSWPQPDHIPAGAQPEQGSFASFDEAFFGGQPASNPGPPGSSANLQQPPPASFEQKSGPNQAAATSRVPWALPPPTKDLPRPGISGHFVPHQPAAPSSRGDSQWQAFEQISALSLDADAAHRLQQSLQLNSGNSNSNFGGNQHSRFGGNQHVQDSTQGDAALARQLQEQWDRENGSSFASGQPAAVQGLAPKLGLRRPSSVAGTPPTESQVNPLRTSQDQAGGVSATSWQHFSQGSSQRAQEESMQAGGSDAAHRARAFLHRSGDGNLADEEYAKKLQQEYDAEHAKGLGHSAAASTASHPEQWRMQQQTSSTAKDEAYARKLQEAEIARQRRRQGWPAQAATSNPTPAHPGYGHPPPQNSDSQPWWSPQQQLPPLQPYQGGQTGRQNFGGQPPTNITSDDEALARRLQEQYDAEHRGAAPPRQQGAPPPAQQTAGLPSRPSAPTWKSRFDRLLSPNPDSLCLGCKKPVVGIFGGTYKTASGGVWHPECLRCGGCQQQITDRSFTEHEGKPFHLHCFKEANHPRCCVCSQFCPQENNQIHWTTDDFWKFKACPQHANDGTKKCYACNRYQVHGQEWVQVSTEGQRHLCLDCVSSVVVDTQDAQPLYAEVLGFYERMQMRLPSKPPLLLVEPSALESAETRERRHSALSHDGNAPVFHTRGMTLTMEYTQMRSVVRNRGSSWFDLRPEVVNIPSSSHSEVTAILVLAGLPRLMTGSILAHECMHAWLRMSGTTQISLEVEEGLCQLMALLWLEQQQPTQKGDWDERFGSYCAHKIRTETSPVYGGGFRSALDNFQKFGLPAVVQHVRQTGRFAI